MGFFNHHTKTPQEATTYAGTYTSECTTKDGDTKTLSPSPHAPAGASINNGRADRKPTQLPESNYTAPIQPEALPGAAGPAREMWSGNENLTRPGAPPSEGLLHEKKHSKEKHHFWQHTKHRDNDGAQQMEYLRSRGFDEEHAKHAVENVERERHDSGRRKSLADKILGSLPAEDDPLSKGNLGQGLVWR